MGSIGASRNTAVSATRENEFGFEVENSNSPELEFTDSVWQEMAELRAYDAFEDSDLRSRVDDRISELVDQYDDLANYDSDLTSLREHIEAENVTDDEYWTAYHVMAKWLGIQPNRYTILDSNQSAWDEKFTSVESAEQWASQRDEATYVYDTWTRKYRKIGNKNWRTF